tara:strand:+ start:1204 stop:1413 length:210 start_codon:yes stop_codon:yes gene_type:complete
MKRGRWSSEEFDELYDMVVNTDMTYEEISVKLNRKVSACKRVMDKIFARQVAEATMSCKEILEWRSEQI